MLRDSSKMLGKILWGREREVSTRGGRTFEPDVVAREHPDDQVDQQPEEDQAEQEDGDGHGDVEHHLLEHGGPDGVAGNYAQRVDGNRTKKREKKTNRRRRGCR